MPSFEHKKLVEKIASLDLPPTDKEEFRTWVRAGEHLRFLEENAHSDELVIYGSGEYSFVHTLAVSEKLLKAPDQADLLAWNCDPFSYAASYVSGAGREGMWVERGLSYPGSKVLETGTQLLTHFSH